MESFEFNETFFSLLKGQIRKRSHSYAIVIPVCCLFIYNIAISNRAWQLNIVTLSHANFRLHEILYEIPEKNVVFVDSFCYSQNATNSCGKGYKEH